MPRIADLKIWVRITAAIWLVLALIWAGAIVWTTQVNRDTAIRQAQEYTWESLKHAYRTGRGQLIPNRLFWARSTRASRT